jgi:hypothetical protein
MSVQCCLILLVICKVNVWYFFVDHLTTTVVDCCQKTAVVETTVIEPTEVTKIFSNPMSKRNFDAVAVADAEPKTKKPKLDESKDHEVIDLTGAESSGCPDENPVGTPFTPTVCPIYARQWINEQTQERLCRGDARRMPVSELVTLYEEQMNFRYIFVEDEKKKKWCIDLDMRRFKSCDKNEKVEQLVLALKSKRDILTVQLITGGGDGDEEEEDD